MSEEKAWNKALNFLSFRARTLYEMRSYLKKHDYEPYSEKIINRLQECGYLDDKQFAKSWIKDRLQSKSLGKARLKEELFKKGISKEIIEEQLEELYDDAQDFERALTIAQKRLPQLKSLDFSAARRRLSQYIIRHGFPSQVAWRVCQKLLPSRDRPAGQVAPSTPTDPYFS